MPDLAELITRPIESLDHVSDLSTAPDTTVDALPVPGSYAELPEDTMDISSACEQRRYLGAVSQKFPQEKALLLQNSP